MKGYELVDLLSNINKYRKFFHSRVSGDGITITDDGYIDFHGDVRMGTTIFNNGIPEELKELAYSDGLPLNFKQVKGNFDIYGLSLESLKGCPEVVDCTFDCRYNALSDLNGGPKNAENYYCDCNDTLQSLEGGPEIVYGTFDCSECCLTSLKGGPRIVGNYLIRENSEPIDLKYLPKEIEVLDVSGTEINQIDTDSKINQIYCEGCSVETIHKLRYYFGVRGTIFDYCNVEYEDE